MAKERGKKPVKNCEKCEPGNIQCTVETLAAAVNKPVVLDDTIVARETDGSYRPLTKEEEEEVGIEPIERLEGDLPESIPLYGVKSHCPLHLVIKKRDAVPA